MYSIMPLADMYLPQKALDLKGRKKIVQVEGKQTSRDKSMITASELPHSKAGKRTNLSAWSQRSTKRPSASCNSSFRPHMPTLGRWGPIYQHVEQRAEQQSWGFPCPSNYSNFCCTSQSLWGVFSLLQQKYSKENHNHPSDTNTLSLLQDISWHQHSLQMIHQESAQRTSSSMGKHLTNQTPRVKQVSQLA